MNTLRDIKLRVSIMNTGAVIIIRIMLSLSVGGFARVIIVKRKRNIVTLTNYKSKPRNFYTYVPYP